MRVLRTNGPSAVAVTICCFWAKESVAMKTPRTRAIAFVSLKN